MALRRVHWTDQSTGTSVDRGKIKESEELDQELLGQTLAQVIMMNTGSSISSNKSIGGKQNSQMLNNGL